MVGFVLYKREHFFLVGVLASFGGMSVWICVFFRWAMHVKRVFCMMCVSKVNLICVKRSVFIWWQRYWQQHAYGWRRNAGAQIKWDYRIIRSHPPACEWWIWPLTLRTTGEDEWWVCLCSYAGIGCLISCSFLRVRANSCLFLSYDVFRVI